VSTKTTKGDSAFIDERGPGGWRAVDARWDRLGRLRRGAAIEDARRKGYTLGKYADPTEGERVGLTDEEAAEVACEDISLVFVAVG